MLTLTIVPGSALGPFTLGVSVGQALALAAELVEPEGGRVDVKLSEQPEADIVLNFSEYGFHLRFEARSQQLRLVEVYDPTRIAIRYGGAVMGGATAVTLQRVSAMFGPTFPGEVCAERGIFTLHYPGLAFIFPGSGSQAAAAARVVLCAPAAHAAASRAPRLDAVLAAAPPAGPPAAGALVAAIGFGLRLPSGGALPFGASPQDLIAELGPPSASMTKGADAMIIHAAPGQAPGASSQDYFMTWSHRGLDALLDGETHRAKKFVLHTNAPCHQDFGAYDKAAFTLETPRGATLSADAHWEEVQAALGANERPAVNAGGPGAGTPPGLVNPLGLPTFVYAFNGVVFEVMRNGRLASVTLFVPFQRRAGARAQ